MNDACMPKMSNKTVKPSILLVDDDQQVLKMLQTFLSSQGYQVICAPGGYEALATIEKQHDSIDLILTDIRMPDMSGIRLLEALRQLHPSLPVLLMTGYTDFDLLAQGLKQHAFDLLMKPIDLEQLAWCITKALAHQAAQRLEEQYRIRLEQQVTSQARLLCEQLESLQQTSQPSAQPLDTRYHLLKQGLQPPLAAITTAIELIERHGVTAQRAEVLELLKCSAKQIKKLAMRCSSSPESPQGKRLC